jgi:hypothetical protein
LRRDTSAELDHRLLDKEIRKAGYDPVPNPAAYEIKTAPAWPARRHRVTAAGSLHPIRRPVISPGRGDGTYHGPRCDDPQSVHGARRIRVGYDRQRETPMVLGFTLGIIYLVLLLVLGVLSFRKGHWVLGLIGFIFPVLWLIGAILPSRYARR